MDIDTKIRMAENELKDWASGRRSNTNIVGTFYGVGEAGERFIAIERADAASIERHTAALKALYLIRDNRKA